MGSSRGRVTEYQDVGGGTHWSRGDTISR